MKLSINKLIANDIINYGMDNASETNYIVSLDTYLKDFDEETQKYILNNIDKITDDIMSNENVLDLAVEKEENHIEFNMIFYWEKLLNQVEHIVLDNAKLLKLDIDFKDIRKIADEILDDDEFNDDLINRLKYYDNEKELN